MRLHIITLILASASLLLSCGTHSDSSAALGDTVTTHARLLLLVDHGKDYTVAKIRNPWDTSRVMATYILVPRSFPDDSIAQLPVGTVVRTPLESSLVYSGVHGGVIDELSAAGAITAVADGQYFSNPTIRKGIDSGAITDVGNSMSPSMEKIVALKPEAILTSPFQNADHGAIEAINTPIIEMADYMEQTPLGRAEWIKFIGRLYGQTAKADSIFNAVADEYTALANAVSDAKVRPTVLTEQTYQGVWSVPGGDSYMARMLADAAVEYPWSNTRTTGSLQLDPAQVLEKARHADYWLIRYFGPMTMESLKADQPLNSRFDAFENRRVYVCDTSTSPLFDEFPFHPERLLLDYVAIFHPELSIGTGRLRYFKRL